MCRGPERFFKYGREATKIHRSAPQSRAATMGRRCAIERRQGGIVQSGGVIRKGAYMRFRTVVGAVGAKLLRTRKPGIPPKKMNEETACPPSPINPSVELKREAGKLKITVMWRT